MEITFCSYSPYFTRYKSDFVLLDNFRGTYDAVKYLLDLGHKRIDYIERFYGCVFRPHQDTDSGNIKIPCGYK